jgi:hypothetical protein
VEPLVLQRDDVHVQKIAVHAAVACVKSKQCQLGLILRPIGKKIMFQQKWLLHDNQPESKASQYWSTRCYVVLRQENHYLYQNRPIIKFSQLNHIHSMCICKKINLARERYWYHFSFKCFFHTVPLRHSSPSTGNFY